MPIHTYRCPKCKLTQRWLQEKDHSNPSCDTCPNDIEMERVWESKVGPLIGGVGLKGDDYKNFKIYRCGGF